MACLLSPHPMLLAPDAIRMEIPSVVGQMSPSNLTLGNPCEKRSSFMASSGSVTQQSSELAEFINAYKCRVYNYVTDTMPNA